MNGFSAVIDLVPCTELVAEEFVPDQPGHCEGADGQAGDLLILQCD